MSDESTEERHRPGVQREYRNEKIVVHWESRYCIHTGNCIRNLPQVFDLDALPWINVEGAEADQIAATVMTCPTGALHFESLDGAPHETELQSAETKISERL